MEKEIPFEKKTNVEQNIIQLLYIYSVLMEFQLIDLQSNVRSFVEAMSEAIQKMDTLVVEEGQSAVEMYESFFSGLNNYAAELNKLSEQRAKDIFDKAMQSSGINTNQQVNTQEAFKAETEKSEANINFQEQQGFWSEISKKFESFSRLEERLRPQVFIMIQSLNFEDIQSQRIEHALTAQKKLNQGVINFINKGLNNCSVDEVFNFAIELIKHTRSSYTMSEERKVFDLVFLNEKKYKESA